MENLCNEATQAYQEVLKRFPIDPFAIRAKFGIANCAEEMGNFDEAKKLYQELLTSYPSEKVVQKKLANLQSRLKKLPPK